MKDKIINRDAELLVIQINNCLDLLLKKKLIVFCNKVYNVDYCKSKCQITWNNHLSGRFNSGKSFTLLEQYENILSNNSYHCLLFDGSIIRVNFEFERNILKCQNLLWWPAPFIYDEALEWGAAPLLQYESFLEDLEWHKKIKMRSPVRIDFDNYNDSVIHPKSHLHTQHDECRMAIDYPVCFNKFVEFIFKNYYPEYKLGFSKYDYLALKIDKFEKIDYETSMLII